MAPVIEPTEHKDEIERDYALRAHGDLQITNMRGDIVIQGWSLDKIKVKARRRAKAATLGDAQRLFSAVDLRFKSEGGQIELSAEYGRGLSLEERLQERANPRTSMELVVFAPANLKLRIWGVNGSITLKGWNAPVDARAASGSIQLENVKKGGVSVLCPDCSIRLRGIKGPVRAMGGSGEIELAEIQAPHTYVESGAGSIRASRIRGEQLYVAKEGSLKARELEGRIEFHAQSGGVEIVESIGFLSGKSTSGNITAKMRDWSFADKAVIESVTGDIRLSLPRDFSGDVDLQSLGGKAECAFGVDQLTERAQPAASSSGSRIIGRIGDGGELLRVFSAKGAVQLLRAH